MSALPARLIALVWDGTLPVPRPLLQRLAYYALPAALALAVAAAWSQPQALSMLSKKSGSVALALIFGLLAVAPLVRILPTIGFPRLVMSYRRELGVASAWFVLVHFLGLAQGAGILSLQGVAFMFTGGNGFLTAGAIAAAGMTVLAFTSNDIALRLLGRNWKRLHRIAYPVLLIALLHASMAGGAPAKALVIFGFYLLLKFAAARGWHLSVPRPQTA